jgi:catechol 2,3-dioxygenase-like lactoylglutathione lyase family enzyme
LPSRSENRRNYCVDLPLNSLDKAIARPTINGIVYKRLQPVLNVRSIEAERQFYVQLGFTVTYQEEGFAALASGEQVLFGLQEAEQGDPAVFERQMHWQFGVGSVGEVARHCEREGLPVEMPMTLQPWGEWMLVLRSPSGYRIAFEGPE